MRLLGVAMPDRINSIFQTYLVVKEGYHTMSAHRLR